MRSLWEIRYNQNVMFKKCVRMNDEVWTKCNVREKKKKIVCHFDVNASEPTCMRWCWLLARCRRSVIRHMGYDWWWLFIIFIFPFLTLFPTFTLYNYSAFSSANSRPVLNHAVIALACFYSLSLFHYHLFLSVPQNALFFISNIYRLINKIKCEFYIWWNNLLPFWFLLAFTFTLFLLFNVITHLDKLSHFY